MQSFGFTLVPPALCPSAAIHIDEPLAYEEEEDLHPASLSPPGKVAATAAAALLLQGGGEKRKADPLCGAATSSGALERGPAAPVATGDGVAVAPKRRKKAGGGVSSHFVEMEAELSDEDGEGADVSDDEDEPDAEEDGMLVRRAPASVSTLALQSKP